MTRKKVNIKPRSEFKRMEEKLDEWVLDSSNDTQATNNHNVKKVENHEDFFRFTLHMPTALHKKIKRYCVDNEITMKEKIIEILEREFFPSQ
jgi:hypothetical protein